MDGKLHHHGWDDYARTCAQSGENEKRKNHLISRGMPIFSRTLGVRGMCDMVEFHGMSLGVTLQTLGGNVSACTDGI